MSATNILPQLSVNSGDDKVLNWLTHLLAFSCKYGNVGEIDFFQIHKQRNGMSGYKKCI